MSGYPQGQGQGHAQGHGQGQNQGHQDYDDGYDHQGNTDSYYQDDQHYYDNGQNGQNGHNGHHDNRGGQQGDGYYDESYVPAPSPLPVSAFD